MECFHQFNDVNAAILLMNQAFIVEEEKNEQQQQQTNKNKKKMKFNLYQTRRLLFIALPLYIRNGHFEKALELLNKMDKIFGSKEFSTKISLFHILFEQMRQGTAGDTGTNTGTNTGIPNSAVGGIHNTDDNDDDNDNDGIHNTDDDKLYKSDPILIQNNSKPIVRYTANHFEHLLKEMQKRNLFIHNRVISLLTPIFGFASKRHQLLLLELYEQAKKNATTSKSSYQLNDFCYTSLMNVALRQQEYQLVIDIFQDAIKNKQQQIMVKNDGRSSIPRDWYTLMICALVQLDKIPEAYDNLQEMYTKCGEKYSYRALIALGKYHSKKSLVEKEKDKNMDFDLIKLKEIYEMLDQGNFHLSLLDASELIYDAKKRNDPKTALDMIRLFEKANFDSIPQQQQQQEEEEEEEEQQQQEQQEQQEQQQTQKEKKDMIKLQLRKKKNLSLSKVIAMYRAVLGLCETNGLWKRALLLNERLEALLALKNDPTIKKKNEQNQQNQQEIHVLNLVQEQTQEEVKQSLLS
jgi:hypothetical protein